ncbi:MAG: ImmA/IrrE family metallo-endopeptidase, partial [Lachnospiraceae bacterium]|nr:ImmA/IrrE family metallo-endopeptidase [Lachnospiraceae bacterium]
VTDFLANTGGELQFSHGIFRKGSKLGVMNQEYIREAVEEYFGRFFQVVSFLGGQKILEPVPEIKKIPWMDDTENAAKELRKYLGISINGPVPNLVEILENKGILVFFIEVDSDYFSGMNGTVNGIPYIVINRAMSPARIRSTIVHEVAHFAFDWPEDLSDKDEEELATAISGAFLFPKEDAYRELGYKRSSISKAMTMTCKEYGISIYMLVKRARLCEIINDSVEKVFYIRASKAGWRKAEPDWGIQKEEPNLFEQLVYRAVTEEEISVQKGAELLKTSYDAVANACFI